MVDILISPSSLNILMDSIRSGDDHHEKTLELFVYFSNLRMLRLERMGQFTTSLPEYPQWSGGFEDQCLSGC